MQLLDVYRNLNQAIGGKHVWSVADVKHGKTGNPLSSRGKLQRGANGKGAYRDAIVLENATVKTTESDLRAMRAGKNRRVGIWLRGTEATCAPVPMDLVIRISFDPRSDSGFVFADRRSPQLDRKPCPQSFKRVYFTPQGAFVML